MTPDLLRQIEELYQAALELGPDQRASLLAEADPEAQAKVAAMLARESGENFLDRPAWEAETGTLASSPPLAPGARLGQYLIGASIGAGGMGVVFYGSDTRLNRPVAIKFLSDELADVAARRRFQREAQTASSLNHPHILTVYDVGEIDGRQYLVTEFVDGGTLRNGATLQNRTWQDVVELLTGVADGVSTAHQAGILHRDIKPDNILITSSGYANLADFGLAKLEEGSLAKDAAEGSTHSGVIVGTIAYMSPEQASGKPLDFRSDIFSFGVVLYEMLAGHRPFAAATGIALLQQIIRETPAPLDETIPQPLRVLVAKAMGKDPADRYSSMRDLVLDLRRTLRQTATGETEHPVRQLPPTLRFSFRRWMLVGGAVFTAALLIIIGVQWTARAREQNGPPQVSYVTTYSGDEVDPSFSPDGSHVAFSWGGNKSENRDIYVLPVGGQHPLRLTQDPADDVSPAWSPDGLSIAFIRRADEHSGSIMSIPALGGPERLLHTIRMAPQLTVTDIDQRRLAWSPDGEWLVFTNQVPAGDHALFLLSLKTGAIRPLFPGRANGFEDISPAFSRDGRKLAFARFNSVTRSVLLVQQMTPAMEPEGEPLQVPNLGPRPHSPAWDMDGRLLFIDSSVIERFEIGGTTKTVYQGDAHLRGLSVSATRLIAVRTPFNFDILAIPLHPGGLSATGPAVPLASSTAAEFHPRFSPDGKQLAFVSDRGGSQELWLADADGGNPKQLTSLGAYIMGYPSWSLGGQQIAFNARIQDTFQVYVLDVAGGLPRQITNDGRDTIATSWSDDGKTLYVGKMTPGHSLVYKVPAQGGKEEPVFSGEGWFPVVAHSGRLLLYAKTNSFGIFSRALDQASASSVEQRLVDDYLPPNGGIYPLEDGFYYLSSTSAGVARAFRFYDFATKKSVDVAPAPAKIGRGLSVSPDRRRLAYCAEAEGNADLILLEWK